MYFSIDDNPYECPMANYIDSGPGAYGPSTYKTNCKNGNLQIQKQKCSKSCKNPINFPPHLKKLRFSGSQDKKPYYIYLKIELSQDALLSSELFTSCYRIGGNAQVLLLSP